ncbi:CaiB/BaiF CoA-transferase family protein [Sphingomonas sp.]|uniref:CaiB/BaiF CoA transferase family protein n=1 Tax=Sphingomonas sp. TaxID=28214 RepID=UPI002BCF5168|nr:CaiB/BaiF CoA-transferase family protein [Sphingomonas sp.]HWK35433.1 CaiB/BaiF CoA-transferase family protein [Sphingomonas sp.]
MTALDGIRVLELSRVVAGPWASQLLADFGADVIKVEHPAHGDDTRSWGPPYLAHDDGTPSRESGYFLAANRGKRSLAIDFADPAGLAVVTALADRADVIIENFRVGALARYGLDPVSVAARNPRAVYCSITGFGQDGPRAGQGGYDFNMQAMGGLMSITGQPDGSPGGGPVKVGVAITDLFTGMYAGSAVLAALHARDADGAGQHIDIALFDVQLAMLANQGMNHLVDGRLPQRLGNDHPNVVPCGAFDTADGRIVITVGNDVQYARLCVALEAPALARDPRFATNADRCIHRAALIPLLIAAFARRPTDDWLDRLAEAKVTAAQINTIPQAFADPQAVSRGARRAIGASYATVPTIANPVRFSRTAIAHDRAPPALGEHSAAILAELGIESTAITDLFARGVVRCASPTPARSLP